MFSYNRLLILVIVIVLIQYICAATVSLEFVNDLPTDGKGVALALSVTTCVIDGRVYYSPWNISNSVNLRTMKGWRPAAAIKSDGNEIILGDQMYMSPAHTAGKVFYYYKNNEQWYGRSFSEPNPSYQDRFGTSVSINEAGDYMIVGAWGDDILRHYWGAGFVYKKTNSNSWMFDRHLLPWDLPSCSGFTCPLSYGWSSSLANNVAVFGAPYYQSPYITSAYPGLVYVWRRDENGLWNSEAKLLANDHVNEDQFGYSVDINGLATTLLIGAIGADNKKGCGYFFEYINDNWTQIAKLIPPIRVVDSLCGSSVALNSDGNLAVIGCPAMGSFTLFRRVNNVWNDIITKSHVTDFGGGAAFSNDLLLIGGRTSKLYRIVEQSVPTVSPTSFPTSQPTNSLSPTPSPSFWMPLYQITFDQNLGDVEAHWPNADLPRTKISGVNFGNPKVVESNSLGKALYLANGEQIHIAFNEAVFSSYNRIRLSCKFYIVGSIVILFDAPSVRRINFNDNGIINGYRLSGSMSYDKETVLNLEVLVNLASGIWEYVIINNHTFAEMDTSFTSTYVLNSVRFSGSYVYIDDIIIEAYDPNGPTPHPTPYPTPSPTPPTPHPTPYPTPSPTPPTPHPTPSPTVMLNPNIVCKNMDFNQCNEYCDVLSCDGQCYCQGNYNNVNCNCGASKSSFFASDATVIVAVLFFVFILIVILATSSKGTEVQVNNEITTITHTNPYVANGEIEISDLDGEQSMNEKVRGVTSSHDDWTGIAIADINDTEDRPVHAIFTKDHK